MDHYDTRNKNVPLLIYPNPLTSKTAQLQFTNQAGGVYDIRFINTAGQVLQHSRITHSGGSATQSLPLEAGILPGLYKVVVTGPANESKTWSILVK